MIARISRLLSACNWLMAKFCLLYISHRINRTSICAQTWEDGNVPFSLISVLISIAWQSSVAETNFSLSFVTSTVSAQVWSLPVPQPVSVLSDSTAASFIFSVSTASCRVSESGRISRYVSPNSFTSKSMIVQKPSLEEITNCLASELLKARSKMASELWNLLRCRWHYWWSVAGYSQILLWPMEWQFLSSSTTCHGCQILLLLQSMNVSESRIPIIVSHISHFKWNGIRFRISLQSLKNILWWYCISNREVQPPFSYKI